MFIAELKTKTCVHNKSRKKTRLQQEKKMPQFSKDLPIYIGFVHKLLVFINKIILSENVRMLLLTLNPQFLEASKPILRPKYELNYDKLHVSNTYKFTMNGWLISAKMLFSFLTCSTCLSRMTSAMASIFMAQYVLVVLSWHKHTRPNVPVPVLGEKNKNRRERWKKGSICLGMMWKPWIQNAHCKNLSRIICSFIHTCRESSCSGSGYFFNEPFGMFGVINCAIAIAEYAAQMCRRETIPFICLFDCVFSFIYLFTSAAKNSSESLSLRVWSIWQRDYFVCTYNMFHIFFSHAKAEVEMLNMT